MFAHRRLWPVAVAAALLGVAVGTPAQATKPQPFSDLYITSYNGGCTHQISVILNPRVTKSWEPAGGPCAQAPALAVARTIRTIGVRPGEVGAEYTLGRVPTGVTYAYPDTLDTELPEGTTDGRFNYAGGYFDGTVYRFTRRWTDPVALFSTGVYLGGITYDSHTRTLWVLDSRADFEEGTGEIRNYTMHGTLLSSFVVTGGSTPQPFGLAYDAKDHSLWISRIVGFDQPIVLEKYSTTGAQLATVTTKIVGTPVGMEFRLARGHRHHHHHHW